MSLKQLIFVSIGIILAVLVFALYRNKIFRPKDKRILYHRGTETTRQLLLNNLPLGICLISKKGRVLWYNQLFPFLMGKNLEVGEDFRKQLPGLLFDHEAMPTKNLEQDVVKRAGFAHLDGKTLHIKTQKIILQEEAYLYICQDFTKEIKVYTGHRGDLPVFICIQTDNRAEVLKAMTDEAKPVLLSAIESAFLEWAGKHEGFLSSVGEGRYLLIVTQWGLKQMVKERFPILDKIREIEVSNPIPLTISIGVGTGEENISSLSRLAQSALDLAQERGGDQVVVQAPEKTRFYGGKSMTAEKKTKVKTRLTADKLMEMMLTSSQVLIMGHEMADYDSIGSALGIFRAAQDLGKRAWIIRDRDTHNPAFDKLLQTDGDSGTNNEYSAVLLEPQEASRSVIPGTLLVVVDTHKPTLLPEPGLLQAATQIVVIDHHRRGEEFISQAALIYLESYASSTSELVTELLQYMGARVELKKAEATALLAGITVDTKNFIYQTGVRTFAAASYLRSMGADPAVVQKLLQDDLKTVIQKAEVISRARILYGQIALSASDEPAPEAQLLAAKAADSMLNIKGVNGVFVLWSYGEGVAISARSNGKINVQTIMEKLGGGGHLTVAAVQLPGSLADAETALLNVLEELFQEAVSK